MNSNTSSRPNTVNAIQDPRVRAAVENHPLDHENTTPVNTPKAYKPKQEEREDRCHDNWPPSEPMQTEHETRASAVEKAMPVIAAELRTIAGELITERQRRRREHDELLSRMDALERNQRESMEGSLSITWTPGRSRIVRRWEPGNTQARDRAGEPPMPSTPTPVEQPQRSSPAECAESQRPVPANVKPDIPCYTLPRGQRSVKELLGLWRNGIGAMPSIDSLEERWGTKWRPSKEKQFFSSRKVVIDEVVRRARAQNLPETVIAEQMDREYSSVDKAFKTVREKKKAGAAG